MKSLLLIADTRQQRAQLHDMLAAHYTLYTATSVDEALEYLQLTKIDVVMATSESRAEPVVGLFAQAKRRYPYCVTLCVAPALPADFAGAAPPVPPGDVLLRHPVRPADLLQTLEQAIEKQRLLEELAVLRAAGPPPPPPPARSSAGDLSLARIGQILRHFAKAFSTNFDLQESLQLFLEAMTEFVRPSRLSIMVLNPQTRTFDIRAQHGLAPKIAAQIRFRADEGLPHWLLSEARLLHRSEVEAQTHQAVSRELAREMQALKAVVSLPLLVSGKLVGIINLGERITGVPYSEDELEMLFSLASQVAVGIQDSTLYQAMQVQKTFTEKILRYMSSGVISITCDEKISVCNHRAAQILGKTWADVLHQDLRSLPSPLGDLLYETLHDGKTYHNYEVTLAAGQLPVEVNTYQVLHDGGEVSGSVMVFDDLTYQKLLHEERRRADQLDFLNKVVGRMAHEIKNPLVSIQTFVELLTDHADDAEFKDEFRRIVSRDVRAINGITEKLVSFASKIAYQFAYQDLPSVLQQFVGALKTERSPGLSTPTAADHAGEARWSETIDIELVTTDLAPCVKFDPEQFQKALKYLAVFLLQGMRPDGRLVVASAVQASGPQHAPGEWVYITLTGKGRRLPVEELQQLFDPFCMDQNTLVDVGPCVSQKIIEEHGGHLEVRQEKHGDTTFVIALPVAQELTEASTGWTHVNVF